MSAKGRPLGRYLFNIIFAGLVVLGILVREYNLSLGAIILYINFKYKDINLLYSISIVLLFFVNSAGVEDLGIRLGSLQYLTIFLIFIRAFDRESFLASLKSALKDRNTIAMILVVGIGSLSAAQSIRRLASLKSVVSIGLVFLVFYLVPRYFYDRGKREDLFKYILYPYYSLTMLVSLLNIGFHLGILRINKYIKWNTRETFYNNSNYFGLGLLMLATMINLYFFRYKAREEKEIRDEIRRLKRRGRIKNISINKMVRESHSEEYKKLKNLVVVSYVILLYNLILSGSRTSIIGAFVLFLPALVQIWDIVLMASVPLGLVFLFKRHSLYLLSKLGRGTTGRSELWRYGIRQVIAKKPLLGVGGGAFREYMFLYGNKSIHNAYLHVIMTNGVFAILPWLAILYDTIKKIFRLDYNQDIYLFTILSYLVYAIFEIGLFGGISVRMGLFWFIIMLVNQELEKKEYGRK